MAALFSFVYPLTDALGSAPANLSSSWLLVPIGILAYLAWLHSVTRNHRDIQGLMLIASLLLQIALTLLAGLLVHRDFFTLLFQSVLIHIILFLDSATLFRSRHFFGFAERLYAFTLAIIAFTLFWIALMGFAIATRSEPRWLPSLFYNILNVGMCCFLYLANLGLRRKSKRELIMTGNSVILDQLDISPLFSPSTLPLATYFFRPAPNQRLTCQDAQALLQRQDCPGDCNKATSCAGYKYVYNRIHELKRICLALRIGTISDPDNKRNILQEGWVFNLDPSISLPVPK